MSGQICFTGRITKEFLKLLQSVDAGSSFQTFNLRTEKKYFLMSVLLLGISSL